MGKADSEDWLPQGKRGTRLVIFGKDVDDAQGVYAMSREQIAKESAKLVKLVRAAKETPDHTHYVVNKHNDHLKEDNKKLKYGLEKAKQEAAAAQNKAKSYTTDELQKQALAAAEGAKKELEDAKAKIVKSGKDVFARGGLLEDPRL